MLLLAISGADPQAAADTSRALVGALRASGEFRLVANGESSLEAIRIRRWPIGTCCRRLWTTQDWDAGFLSAQLEERVRDLSFSRSGAAGTLAAAGPDTRAAGTRRAAVAGRRRNFSTTSGLAQRGRRPAVAETRAVGIDPEGQRRSRRSLQRAFRIHVPMNLRLESSGPGVSVLMQERTQGEANGRQRQRRRHGDLVAGGLPQRVGAALGLLPLVSAGVPAWRRLASSWHRGRHDLLRLHVDRRRPGRSSISSVTSTAARRALERSRLVATLATGVASISSLTWGSVFRVRGLAQLSVFTVTGLAVAGLTTRFLLPSLVPESSRDAADSARLGQLWRAIAGLPRPLWLGVATTIACVVYLALSPRPLWENDLGALTPIPPALLARLFSALQELGAPDVRYLLVIEDTDAESVLRKAADLDPKLQALVARGVLGGNDQPALPLVQGGTGAASCRIARSRRPAGLAERSAGYDSVQAGNLRAFPG